MASADWKREQVEHLIEVYRKHPVLYNMRHPRYYNKTSRGEALAVIVAEMHEIRPDTTTQDVLRKIQTLRTQFGQEIAKSRRASNHGNVYNPTAWWFKGLSFLQEHIKHRSLSPGKGDSDMSWKREDNDSSYKIAIVRSEPADGEMSNNEYEHSMDGTEYDTEIHYEIDAVDNKNVQTVELKAVPSTLQYGKQSNGAKRPRTSGASYATDPLQLSEQSPSLAANVIELPNYKEQSAAPPVGGTFLSDVFVTNDRNRSLGNFVASQMAHIKDDYSFYSTQMEVLNVINRAILKQLAEEKATSGTGSGERSTASNAASKQRLCEKD